MDLNIIKEIIAPNTMCSQEQVIELDELLEEVFENKIDGDIVECGTWRGGLACLIVQHIIKNIKADKKVYIYDTFEGMPEPEPEDVGVQGEKAIDTFNRWKRKDGTSSKWCSSGIEFVESNLNRITENYKIYTNLIKGKVEDTLLIKENLPKKICLMRLDTDWYRSTKIELETFYPMLSTGGIVIIDDYNHWLGQQKAVNEFLDGLEWESFETVIGANAGLIIRKLK
jgi:hypothetical protein